MEDLFELQVLALGFKEPGAIATFKERLNPEDVGLIHGHTGIYELYKSMLSFYDKTRLDPVDPIAFESWLSTETDIYEALGGAEGVKELNARIETLELSNVESVIKLVEFRSRKRRQLSATAEIIELIDNKGNKSGQDLEKLVALTEQIKKLNSDLDYDPLAKVRTAADIANQIDDLWNVPPFLPTQYKSLNRAMGYTDNGGFFRGGVHSIIAMSGFGKTTLARCLCNNWLDEGYTVLFINFEEPQQLWERTLMTQLIKKNVYAFAESISLDEKQELSDQFAAKLAEWGDRFMVRHDPETLFFEDLEVWLRDILTMGNRKPDVVVIDTIQSMFTKSGGKARWGEFEQIMVRLEKLAKDMDAVFIITSQQNNNAVKEKREVLNQSDTGGGVTIAQKSTVTLFITPKKLATGDDATDETIMQIQIPKNRITGTAFANDPPMMKYEDSIKSYLPFEVDYNDLPDIYADKIDHILEGDSI